MSNAPKSIFERHRVVTLGCVNIIGIVLLLCFAEILVRIFFPEIKPFYLSSHLIQKNKFGTSFGLLPHQRGFTGPAEVMTDCYGFRTASRSAAIDKQLPTILFLGDSVLFGHNVAAEKIFVEIVKNELKGRVNVIGASAPGWDIDDYIHVIQYFVLPQHKSLNIAAVIVVYCFNDITSLSGSAIQQHLLDQSEPVLNKQSNLIDQLRNRVWAFKNRYNIVQSFNDYLNRYSRLFILIKRHVLDPAQGYYRYESKNYENDNLMEQLRRKIMLMQELLTTHRIPLVVYLVPVAYQLRMYAKDVLIPQQKMKKLFAAMDICAIDTTDFLHQYAVRAGMQGEALFNYGDPMHLSEAGHRALAEKILADKVYASVMQ